jgi:pSer/pThr/pTyr-binding forkhead associated (FHA) protein
VANDDKKFREACGLSGPLRLSVSSEAKEDMLRKELDQPFVLIGRHPGNDLVLNDEKVSRYHAYLQMIGGHLFCLDLESRTGTRWEHNNNGGSGWLEFEQPTEISPFRIQFSGDAPSNGPCGEPGTLPNPLRAQFGDDASLPGVELEFLYANQKRSLWRMTRMLALVGKSSRCKVQLVHPSVAKFHCSLLRTPKGLWVINLRRATFVNGVPVRFARLKDGDVLQVGKFDIGIRLLQEGPTARANLPILLNKKSGVERIAEATLANLPVPAYMVGQLVENNNRALGEPVLVHILNQFNIGQQQMFAQQQQTMAVLLQLLDLMHRDTRGAIRDELDRLQSITQELSSVQAQISDLRSAAPPTDHVAPPAARKTADPAERQSAVQPPAADQKQTVTEKKPAQFAEAGKTVAPPAAEENQEEMHSWLVQRMATLGNEQQNSWQRLFTYLRGKLGG